MEGEKIHTKHAVAGTLCVNVIYSDVACQELSGCGEGTW